MNLPNQLTVLRMALVPVYVTFLLWDGVPYHALWALVVFVAASLTDLLDGKIARARGLVTDFGKFMDPLADKILVMAAMLCFVELDYVSAIVVIIILAREFLVTSLRLIAAGQGKVIAADQLGKLKTVAQMAWIIATNLLIACYPRGGVYDPAEQPLWAVLALLSQVLMALSLALTIASGMNYIWQNRACISTR